VEFQDLPVANGESFLTDDISFTKISLGAAAIAQAAPKDPAQALAQAGKADLEFAARVTPNPSRDDAALSFTITRTGTVRLQVFDVEGRLVGQPLDSAFLPAGSHRVEMSTRDGYKAGIYFYRLRAV